MSYSDEVVTYLKRFEVGKELSTREIINGVHETYGAKEGSIIPSDYCYNITNKDPQSHIENGHPRIPEHLEKRGKYKYLGENYKYNGYVIHKGIIVGEWIDGKYFDFREKNDKKI